jgi:hypothetical protein
MGHYKANRREDPASRVRHKSTIRADTQPGIRIAQNTSYRTTEEDVDGHHAPDPESDTVDSTEYDVDTTTDTDDDHLPDLDDDEDHNMDLRGTHIEQERVNADMQTTKRIPHRYRL